MIVDKNRIYDGWLSLEAGVDGGRSPNTLDPNQCASAENMTFRGGDATVRPGFRRITEVITNPDQVCYVEPHAGHIIGEYGGEVPEPRPSWFLNQDAAFIYSYGVMQSAIAYSPHHGLDCIMAMIGGRLFKIIPRAADAIVTEVAPIDDAPRKLRNRVDMPIAYMTQADKYLIIQDGKSKAIIYDSVNARRAKIETDRDHTEIPTGTIMTYGMGRLCVVVNERDIAFGDLYGSHDLPDSADSLILFTERNFLAEGFDASIPFQKGIITGMSFFPQLDTSTGNGQLLVFSKRGAAAFFLSLPRDQWKTSQFQIEALSSTGLRGHRSVVVTNEDLWFRANDGMCSFRQARSEQAGWPHIPLSTNVRQYLDNDSQHLLKYASAINFDNRVICTTSPIWYQGRPAHYGLVVVDFDILSSFGTNLKPAWEGLWTLPDRRVITQLLVGEFNEVTRAFVFTIDSITNKNELFELSMNDRDDWNNQKIEWEFVTRNFDFSKLSQQSSSFSEASLYDGDIWLRDIID